MVSPGGAIGYCEDSGEIDWLFLSEAAPNEDLPLTYEDAPQINFCPKCGALVFPGARFCGMCGRALRRK
ncbi:MAG: zinc-ribbon domain-containing protein [Christensenellales bacterium]